MLVHIHPKLPMRDKRITKNYYCGQLDFLLSGSEDYEGYLMLKKDQIELHFFEFKGLKPRKNYGQVYIRTDQIDKLYQSLIAKGVEIHPNGQLQEKSWGQKEFSLLDPDNNLLTFGESV